MQEFRDKRSKSVPTSGWSLRGQFDTLSSKSGLTRTHTRLLLFPIVLYTEADQLNPDCHEPLRPRKASIRTEREKKKQQTLFFLNARWRSSHASRSFPGLKRCLISSSNWIASPTNPPRQRPRFFFSSFSRPSLYRGIPEHIAVTYTTDQDGAFAFVECLSNNRIVVSGIPLEVNGMTDQRPSPLSQFPPS